MVVTTEKARPFLKWLGGKTQLLDRILPLIPETVVYYHEPFLGGGTVFFALAQRQEIAGELSDWNKHLIYAYQVAKRDPHELSIVLGLLEAEHSEKNYYHVRGLDRSIMFGGLSRVYHAARFIYLNKAGFNGLHRLNKQGQCNVPWNRKDTVSLPSFDHLKAVSDALFGCSIEWKEFDRDRPRKNNFYYLDPPYIPLKADSFTDYNADGFTLDDHRRLKKYCDRIHEVGGKFLLSNSDTQLTRELWKDYCIEEVEARRNVNSKGDGRGVVKELLIRNY